MSEIIFLVEEETDGGYTAHALGHSIFTQADTLDELRVNVVDAVRCHFPNPQTNYFADSFHDRIVPPPERAAS